MRNARVRCCAMGALAADVLLLASGCAARAQVVLFGEGVAPCPIVVRDGPAGEELADYLKKITGAEFPLVVADEPPAGRCILVGDFDPALTRDLGLDGYVIRTDGERLRIAGSSPTGTLYGVYGFLEDVLGCHWWSHDEEDVPRLATVKVGDLDIRVRPPFSMHNLMNQEAQNSAGRFTSKCRSTSREAFTGSHTLYPLMMPYAESHPEILPMGKDGARKANKLHFCYMAPGIAEALADRLGKLAEQRNGKVEGIIYFAGMGDWYGGMCECPACKAVYEEETWKDPDGRVKPGYSATLLRMINRTAEILEQRYPGIRVGTFAYMSLEAPPAGTVPRQNVVIRVPRLRHCTVHPASTCERNRSFLRNLQRWCEIAPGRVYIWEYGTNFKSFLYPFPCVRSIADNLRLYHEMGLSGVMVQGNYVTTGSDLVVLKNYVWRKVMWNPALQTDALVREFCDGYFGPASAPMHAYVNALEDAVREPKPIHADEFAPPTYLSAEVRARLAILREQALTAAAGQEPSVRRVKETTAGVEALYLCHPAALVERGAEVIREDLGACTWDRAVDLLGSVRNSGVNEWTTGRSFWERVLEWQGGPLVTLKQGDIEVRIEPLVGGRIRQISRNGAPLLQVDSDLSGKTYPRNGGSILGVGVGQMRTVGEPTAARVVLEDGVRIPGWRFGQRQTTVRVTVEVQPDGTIVASAEPAPRSRPQAVAVQTVYSLPAGAPPEVEYHAADGEWKRAAFAVDANEFTIPGAAALRIALPHKGSVVVDEYVRPEAAEVRVAFDAKQHTLTTAVKTAAFGPAGGQEAPFRREIRVRDAAGKAPAP